MSPSNRGEDETPPLFTPSESTTSSKLSLLRKKLRAEKLALELKVAEQTFECLRAEHQQRAKLLELEEKAEESTLKYELKDAIAQEEGMSIKGDIDEELNKLPLESVNDQV